MFLNVPASGKVRTVHVCAASVQHQTHSILITSEQWCAQQHPMGILTIYMGLPQRDLYAVQSEIEQGEISVTIPGLMISWNSCCRSMTGQHAYSLNAKRGCGGAGSDRQGSRRCITAAFCPKRFSHFRRRQRDSSSLPHHLSVRCCALPLFLAQCSLHRPAHSRVSLRYRSRYVRHGMSSAVSRCHVACSNSLSPGPDPCSLSAAIRDDLPFWYAF